MFKELPKVSAVMCTYRRFKCVERAMNCFLAQDYPNKELIIYNTDVENGYNASMTYDTCSVPNFNITIVNCGIDSITKKPYTNVGAIRRDALTHATGDYVVTWDDDDIFLPHFIRQGIDKIETTGLPSFKPAYSFFYSGNNLRLVRNTMEASIVADIKKVREYGYLLETGKEGLGWYTKMRDNGELFENDDDCIPSYCFNWNDGDAMDAPHKQSGDIDNPDNFNNHKAASKDIADKALTIYSENKIKETYQDYFDYLKEHEKDFDRNKLIEYYPSMFE
jgi:glycosyltransferase involved in cell wall biosynthesis